MLIQVSSTPASAGKPIRDEFEFSVTACGTTIDVLIAVDGERIHKAGPDGSVRITGVLKVRFTNPVTKQSVLANVSGPATLTQLGDGTQVLWATGRGGGPDLAGGITLAAGPGVLITDPDGTEHVTDYASHHWDLCPLLT
jgi:hypothetical protein